MRDLDTTMQRATGNWRRLLLRSAVFDMALGALAAFLAGFAMGVCGCDRALVAPISGAAGLIVGMTSLVAQVMSALDTSRPAVAIAMEDPEADDLFDGSALRPWRAEAVRSIRFLERDDDPRAYIPRERAFGFSALAAPSRGAP